MKTIDWVLFNIRKPYLTGETKSGLPLAEATLSIAQTNNPEFFKLEGNKLQVWAPPGTPVQISWSLPKGSIGKGVQLNAFTGINLEPPTNGYPANKEFPTAIISSEPFCRAETCGGLSLMMPETPTLTLVDTNIAPEGSKPPYTYKYSIVFLATDAQYYLWDPILENNR